MTQFTEWKKKKIGHGLYPFYLLVVRIRERKEGHFAQLP